jgi:hypothetical protein
MAAAIGAGLSAQPYAAGSAGGDGAVRFTDASQESGLDFRHVNGASPDKHLVETMGSGGLFFDYDNDGWMDVFLVDGGSLDDAAVAKAARHRLYRNRRDGTFVELAGAAGIRHGAYGMGTCAGDVDNDGWVDLYVTSFGANALYRNQQGQFTDVTQQARVGSPLWSASCAFADVDRDGDLDLFVVNYVAADPKESPFCGSATTRTRFYCHPLNYDPLPNTLYLNDGKGVFTDVTARAGLASHLGNGLGVVIGDYDDDGLPDIFVANDSRPNFLFRNTGDGRFSEVALAAGVAVASDGRARAGMGTDAADYDGDGALDLVVTNLDFETHSLFRSLGDRLFAHATTEGGIGFATLPFVGFGVGFLDVDHDTRLDLAIVNGHIMDNAPEYRAGATYAQRNLLFRNVSGRRFAEIGQQAGAGYALEKVSRGLVYGDVDNDGDLDILVTNNGQSADLLRNDSPGGRSLLIRLVGTAGNRDGIGARVRVTSGGVTQLRETKAGSSYLGQNDPRVHVGLGGSNTADRVEVRWPSGRVDSVTAVAAGHIVTIREGEGIVSRVPFSSRP